MVTEWVTRQRRSEKADVQLARRAPPARLLSRLLTAQRVQLAKTDAVTVAAIETGVPGLAVARSLMERFHRMLRARDVGALPGWLAETGTSLLASFGKGIAADLSAVVQLQTEGRVGEGAGRSPVQAVAPNRPATKVACAGMSRPPTSRTCPFLTIAMAS